MIACSDEARQGGFYGQVCYSRNELEGRGKENECEVEGNAVLLVTDPRGDEDGVQEFSLNSIKTARQRARRCGEGAAMFDVGL